MYRHYRARINMMSASPKNREMTSKHVHESMTTPETGSDQGTSALSEKENSKKTFKSSIVIIPPEGCWSQIQAIRKVHDKTYDRWMPHVNMVYPFLADTNDGQVFREAAEKLENKLANFKPFKVRMSPESFHFFTHKKFCTLWLKPEVIQSEGSEVDHAATATGVDVPDVKSVDPIQESLKVAAQDTDNADYSSATADDSHHDEDLLHESDPAKNVKAQEPSRLAEVPRGSKDVAGQSPPSMSKKQQKKQAKAQARQQREIEELEKLGDSHPDVLHLQRALEEEFPVCNDVSNISERGFTPHLSLGQFSPRDVQKFTEQFQNEWETIEFLVDNVCLISRADFHDPFHVRHKVSVGGDGGGE